LSLLKTIKEEGGGERMNTDKTRENRLRRLARRKGYVLRKDRARTRSGNHQGGYMIIEADRNVIVAGEKFDLSLDHVENYLGRL
jgi:hypothetical protein